MNTTKARAKAKAGSVDAHRAAEAKAKALHRAAVADLAEAEALIAQRTTQVEAAEAAVRAIEAAWARGDDGPSAADLVNAQAQVRKAQSLLAAAEASKSEAKRRQGNEDTRLAEIVAAAAEKVGPFSAVATFIEPQLGSANDPEPALYAIQTEAAKPIGGGELAGSVTILNVRDSRWKELSTQRLQRHLEDDGMVLEVKTAGRPRTVADGIELDRHQVTFMAAHEAMPTIARDPNDYVARGLGGRIVKRAQNMAGSDRLRLRDYGQVAGVERSGRERKSVVTVDVAFWAVGPGSNSLSATETAAGFSSIKRRPVHESINDAAQSLVGEFVAGLGIVNEVERGATPDNFKTQPHESSVRFTVTCVSRTPAE